MPSATTSGADGSSNGAARNRAHNQGNQGRQYSVEQERAVVRIRRCKATAFYEILEVQKSCTDAEVKKAYRKQSLLTHPDKNGHEHADEAFKMVARAFSVLGDKEKREKFDRFGTDPDSRFASAQAQNPFSGFARRGAAAGAGGGGGMGGGGMWEDEISPEEMFQRFFGGGGFGPFGGGFDTGPQFVFNLGGGPGIRVHQFGGARPRRRPREGEQEQETSIFSTILGLLPILLLFVFPLLSSLFSGPGPQPVYPKMVFDKPQAPYTYLRKTANDVKYYVNPQDAKWTNYKESPSKLRQLDNHAEITLINTLSNECDRERLHQRRLREAAQGFIFQDKLKMEEANSFPMPSCDRLHKMGYRR